MLGKKILLLLSYGSISKALLLDCKQRTSVHIFRKPCLMCPLSNYTFQLACLYKLVSKTVTLKETLLYGSSVELSRNLSESGMARTVKKS